MHHIVELTQEALIGSLTALVPPILRIESGDSIEFQTLDAGWGAGPSNAERHKPFERRNSIDWGHALVGPIFVNGARKGMTLAVTFNAIVPGSYGFTAAGRYPNWQNQMLRLTEVDEIILSWHVDNVGRRATCSIGDRSYEVPIRPFMGVVGMPPDDAVGHSTWPPRYCGGNIDCRELVVGSTLFLPIAVDGAYLAVGDGHAAQGDGEISCQAIECPMSKVDITVRVEEGMQLRHPRANTPAGWITFGFHEDLNEATVQALDGMLELMGELYGLSRVEAMALGSTVVDLRITQIVNGTKGVHACLPHGLLEVTSPPGPPAV
jgi:acetamidase/formamidase